MKNLCVSRSHLSREESQPSIDPRRQRRVNEDLEDKGEHTESDRDSRRVISAART